MSSGGTKMSAAMVCYFRTSTDDEIIARASFLVARISVFKIRRLTLLLPSLTVIE